MVGTKQVQTHSEAEEGSHTMLGKTIQGATRILVYMTNLK